MSDAVGKYIVDRLKELEHKVEECEWWEERWQDKYTEVRTDLLVLLSMVDQTQQTNGGRIELDVWEAYDGDRYEEVKQTLQKYGKWKEIEICEAEVDTTGSGTSQETGATSAE